MAQRTDQVLPQTRPADLFLLSGVHRRRHRGVPPPSAEHGGAAALGRRPTRRLTRLRMSLAVPATDFAVTLLAGPLAIVFASMPGVSVDVLDVGLAGIIPVLTVATFFERGLYNSSALRQPARLRQIALGWFQAFGLLLVAAAMWSTAAGRDASRVGLGTVLVGFGKPWISASLAIGLAGLLVTRAMWAVAHRHLVGQAVVRTRVVVVGGGPEAAQVIGQLCADPDSGVEVVGIVDERDWHEGRTESRLDCAAVLGGIKDLDQAVRRNDADTVIVALPWTARARIAAALAAAERLPVNVRLAPDATTLEYLHYPVASIAGQPLLEVRNPPFSGAKAVVKRAEDLTIASALLLVLWPVLLLIVAAIKLESRGPVLFRQPRRGFNNRTFQLCKFRSMYHDVADIACRRQTSRGDPRVTRVGAFLRRHSLDELPQLLNVLRGEMSIVGPRPHALGTLTEGFPLEEALDSYVARYRVKPGITGWAQVNGARGEIDTCEKLRRRVELDLDYIERWSLLLDFRIIGRSARCVVHDNAAF